MLRRSATFGFLALTLGCGPSTSLPAVLVPDMAVDSTFDFAQSPTDMRGADLRGADMTHQDLAGPPADLVSVNDLAAPAADMTGVCGVNQIVINEVQMAGNGGASDEWVELFNPCSSAASLTGWKIVYRAASNSTTDTVLANLSGTLAANSYLLAANSGYAGGNADITPLSGSGMSSTAGGVGLRDSSNNLIDSVAWGTGTTNGFQESSSVSAPPSASSIARSPNGRDTNMNSVDFVVLSPPTPRAAN